MSRKLLREVETLQSEVLKTYQPLLGDRHPNTLRVVAGLAKTYALQCRVQEAEAMYTQLMADVKITFGNEHLETISITQDLAIMYNNQGRLMKLIYSRSQHLRLLSDLAVNTIHGQGGHCSLVGGLAAGTMMLWA